MRRRLAALVAATALAVPAVAAASMADLPLVGNRGPAPTDLPAPSPGPPAPPGSGTDAAGPTPPPPPGAVEAFAGLADVAVDELPAPRPAPVELRCRPSPGEPGAAVTDDPRVAVACSWRAGDEVVVDAWQLWKARLRPSADGRLLVAEVGAEVTTHVDTDVEPGAVYAYVVLGLDPDTSIVARSRIVVVPVPGPRDADIRLVCRPVRGADDRPEPVEPGAGRDDGDVTPPGPPSRPPGLDVAVGVACRWEPADDVGEIGGFVLERGVDGADPLSTVAELGADARRHLDTDVSVGHRYLYRVVAVDGAGGRVAVSPVVGVVLGPRPLPGPIGPGGPVPGDRVPGDHLPGDHLPGGPVPGDHLPGDRVPGPVPPVRPDVPAPGLPEDHAPVPPPDHRRGRPGERPPGPRPEAGSPALPAPPTGAPAGSVDPARVTPPAPPTGTTPPTTAAPAPARSHGSG